MLYNVTVVTYIACIKHSIEPYLCFDKLLSSSERVSIKGAQGTHNHPHVKKSHTKGGGGKKVVNMLSCCAGDTSLHAAKGQ